MLAPGPMSQKGDLLTLEAPAGGVKFGTPKAVGSVFVVPNVTVAEGERFVAGTRDVWPLVKATGFAVFQMAVVHWDPTAEAVKPAGAGAYPIGFCADAGGVGSDDTTIRVWINSGAAMIAGFAGQPAWTEITGTTDTSSPSELGNTGDLDDDSAYLVEAQVVAHNVTDGQVYVFKRTAGVRRTGGGSATAASDSPGTEVTIKDGAAAVDFVIYTPGGTNHAAFQVTGLAGKTTSWRVRWRLLKA